GSGLPRGDKTTLVRTRPPWVTRKCIFESQWTLRNSGRTSPSKYPRMPRAPLPSLAETTTRLPTTAVVYEEPTYGLFHASPITRPSTPYSSIGSAAGEYASSSQIGPCQSPTWRICEESREGTRTLPNSLIRNVPSKRPGALRFSASFTATLRSRGATSYGWFGACTNGISR